MTQGTPTTPPSEAFYGRRASTIRDVAALAGVSKSTASRAMLGQGGVSAENLERVQRAAVPLDFVPNEIARSMTNRSSAVIGLFLQHTSSPFYSGLATHFEEAAAARGYRVLSISSNDRPDEDNNSSLNLLVDLRTAGIAVAAPTIDPGTIRQVASRVPVVLTSQMGQPSNPGVPSTAPDPREGVRLIEHVADLGHRSIALLAPIPSQSPTRWARISWMREELTHRGQFASLDEVPPGAALDDLVARIHRDGATAILCNTDVTALDVMAAAARLGLRVPEDLSVVGHDGMSPFDHEVIGLTTYRVPAAGMAEAAVKLLDELVNDIPASTGGVLLPGKLVIGRSTGPAPTRAP